MKKSKSASFSITSWPAFYHTFVSVLTSSCVLHRDFFWTKSVQRSAKEVTLVRKPDGHGKIEGS